MAEDTDRGSQENSDTVFSISSSQATKPDDKLENQPFIDSAADVPDTSIRSGPKLHLIQHRFTPFLLVMMGFSTVLLFFAVGWIAFLWFGSENPTWTHLVHSNWMTRSITLSALAVRISVSLQAGIATSMLASLVIEVVGIQIFQAPEISMLRFANGGPQSLLWSYWGQPKRLVHTCLLMFLVVTTVASQFASTLLLSDIGTQEVEASPWSSSVKYGFTSFDTNIPGTDEYAMTRMRNQRLVQNEVKTPENYWSQVPNSYAAFAEYSVPPKDVGTIDDTGTKLRAVLPFPEQLTRSSIRNYTGPAFVYDARVVCSAPTFSSLARCRRDASSAMRICGFIHSLESADGLVTTTGGSYFDCALPIINRCDSSQGVFGRKECTDSSWSICALRKAVGGLMSALDPSNNSSMSYRWSDEGNSSGKYSFQGGNFIANNGSREWPVDLGHAWLMLNLSISDGEYFAGQDTYTNKSLRHGPWTDIHVPKLSESFADGTLPSLFRASICFDALPIENAYEHAHDFEVRVADENETKEPVAKWQESAGEYDTNDIRDQLGARTRAHGTRERLKPMMLDGEKLLAMIPQKRSTWRPPNTTDAGAFGYEMKPFTSEKTYSWALAKGLGLLQSSNLIYCLYCGHEDKVNIIQATIFNHILQDTDSPALALQAQLTMILRMAYYAWLPLFDMSSDVTRVQTVPRPVPVSTRGFWAVMGILYAHITLCVVIAAMFLSQTEYSLLGNAWPAFSQIANAKEVRQLLETDPTMTIDKEVDRMIKGSGRRRKTYRVADDSDGSTTLLEYVAGSRSASKLNARKSQLIS